ncbi:hypothetical protein D9M68_920580 [compost metagenome]
MDQSWVEGPQRIGVDVQSGRNTWCKTLDDDVDFTRKTVNDAAPLLAFEVQRKAAFVPVGTQKWT